MVVKIKLFGPLKRFGESGILALELSGDCLGDCKDICTVGELKQQVKTHLKAAFPLTFQAALLDSSVFADEQRILADDEHLPPTLNLALLPPVCGG